MRALKWTGIVLLILLLLGGGLYWWLYQGSRHRELSLQQRIPEAPYVIRINAIEMAKSILTGGKFKMDTIPEEMAKIMRPPQEIGVDLFADPWIFGDSNQVSLAFSLKRVNDFRQYVDTVLAAHHRFTVDSSSGYVNCTAESGKWDLSWNRDGNALFTRVIQGQKVDKVIVHRFFTREDTAFYNWPEDDAVFQVRVNQPEVLPWYLSMIDSGNYTVRIDQNRLVVNQNVRSPLITGPSVYFHVSGRKTAWLAQVVRNVKMGGILEKLDSDPALIAEQEAFLFILDSTYMDQDKVMTYTFDDDFKKRPVRKSVENYRLSWTLATKFRELNRFEEMMAKWKTKGKLTERKFLFKKTTVPVYISDSWLVCGSGELGEDKIELTISDTSDASIDLDMAKLERSLNQCRVSIPEEYALFFKVLRAVSWANNSGYIEFNPEEGSPLSSIARLGMEFQ